MTTTIHTPSTRTEDVKVLAIVGPTGVGKSDLSEALAHATHGEIISADSMQIYRGMDIGTAKVPVALRGVPYHCLDLVDPGEPYSAALFQRDARLAIDRIGAAGLPILVGGTGLYVRAALDDMAFPAGELDSQLRQELEASAAEHGARALHQRLQQVDPASAEVIHPNNVRRTIRALEMAAIGESYALQAAGFDRRSSVYDASYLGLTMEREQLYQRIEQRVDAMIAAGLLEEVGRLLAAGYRDALTASQAIGYKELVPVVEAGADLDEAVDAIKQATRRYAKRQSTWFRADPRIVWIDVTEATPDRVLDEALGLLESWLPTDRPAQPFE